MLSNIQEPKLREEVSLVEPIEYEIAGNIPLPSEGDIKTDKFSTVLENRRSRRVFSKIALEELGPFFYRTCRTKEVLVNDFGLMIEQRNVPSSGALHTINCIVSQFSRDDWYVYNSRSHTFDKLITEPNTNSKFKSKCKEMIDCSQDAYLIWYVCDVDRLKCKYHNVESLALRESGALSATQGLVAESYGLAYCMLGLLGYEQASAFSNKRDLLGVGVAVIGGLG